MNNPIPISSNISDSQVNDPNMFRFSGNLPLSSIPSAHANACSTSTTFSIKSNNGNDPNTSNNGNVPNSDGNAPIPLPWIFCKFTRSKLESLERSEKPGNKHKKRLINRFVK